VAKPALPRRKTLDKPAPPISAQEQEVTIEAAYLAAHLGLTVEKLRAEMRRGIVFGLTERGVGDDLGRKRLTFRYRARSWSVVIEADGSFHDAARTKHG
jgi:hypothetical protein